MKFGGRASGEKEADKIDSNIEPEVVVAKSSGVPMEELVESAEDSEVKLYKISRPR